MHIGFAPVDGNIQRKQNHFPTLAWVWAQRTGTLKVGETKFSCGPDSGLWAPLLTSSEPVPGVSSGCSANPPDQDAAFDIFQPSVTFLLLPSCYGNAVTEDVASRVKPPTLFTKQLLCARHSSQC